MLTLTYLKISRISPVDFSFFPFANLWGNGALGTYSRGLVSSFSSGDESSAFTGTIWFSFVTGISTLLSTSFPFRKVMTALTSPCCCGELVLASCTRSWLLQFRPLRLGTSWLRNLSFSTVIAKVWTEEISCPTIFSRLETDWACELKPALNSFRSPSMVRFCCSIVEWVTFLKF